MWKTKTRCLCCKLRFKRHLPTGFCDSCSVRPRRCVDCKRDFYAAPEDPKKCPICVAYDEMSTTETEDDGYDSDATITDYEDDQPPAPKRPRAY